MGVYIKGINLPENCWECPCLRHDDMDGIKAYQCMATLTTPEDEVWHGKKFDDCPLVKVPASHGRLVDIDRLKEVFRRNVASAEAFDCIFDNAPTVIERSE